VRRWHDHHLRTKALFELGDAAAHAVWVLAKSKTGLDPDGSRVAQQTKAASADLPYKGHAQIRWPGSSLGD
jgi:hypothetical protein